MNKTISSIITLLAILFMTGCVQPKPLYVYGDYNERYYEAKREPSAESDLKLQKSIEKAIQNIDGSSSGRAAPGMYANLGYIYLKGGKTNEAIVSFKKEKASYPESTYFMNRMIKKVEASQGTKND